MTPFRTDQIYLQPITRQRLSWLAAVNETTSELECEKIVNAYFQQLIPDFDAVERAYSAARNKAKKSALESLKMSIVQHNTNREPEPIKVPSKSEQKQEKYVDLIP